MFDDKTNSQVPGIPSAPAAAPSAPAPAAAPAFGTPAPAPMGGGFGAAPAAEAPVQLERDEEGYVIFPKEPITPVECKSSSINTWLTQNTNNFFACKSIYDGKKITYDKFLAELNYDLFDLILKTNLLKTKNVVNKIKKQLIYILVNVKDLPDVERDLIFNTTLRVVDFLKTVVYYPETEKINDEVLAYLPMLKDIAIAFKNFLSKNR